MSIKLRVPVFMVLITLMFASCSDKSAADCKGDVRAYEFGREMATMTVISSSSTNLEKAIQSYSEGLGIAAPYDANNPCVKAGFDEAKAGKESPYNKSGKSWTTF